MSVLIDRARTAHRFLVSQLVYPLILSSLLACGIFAVRVYVSEQRALSILVWNLFLAWIPYLFSLGITYLHSLSPRRGWLLLIPGFLWLIFLPNAPYIVTDILHLNERPPVPLWYDIALLATFAWTGWFLGLVSLRQMHEIADRFFGRAVSWLFALGAIGLTGLGIYLGRVLRWNSWDLLVRPHSVLIDLGTELLHPWHRIELFGVTFLFAAFLLICYALFVSIESRSIEARN